MENNDEKPLLRNNPFFVISIASLIAITMFTISLISYYKSDTRKTIEQIQVNNLNNPSDSASSDSNTQDLNAIYIDNLEKSIDDKISSHSDETDFSPNELTDSALGL